MIDFFPEGQKVQYFTNTLSTKSNPLEVILKPEILDTTILKDGEGSNLYRPSTFDEYIGQNEAKERIKDYIKGTIQFKETFQHTLIIGNSGCGKTTLALILANLLNKKLVICTAGEIKTEQEMINKIAECEGNLIFLDEAHRISTKVGTFLLPILEDFQIQGRKIKRFTMIFGTTHIGNISKNLEALIQRFSLQINLKSYNIEELIQIIKQYRTKKYTNVDISEELYKQIALNCRATPRLALTLLREYAYTLDWQRVLNNNEIVKDGLTKNDFKALKYLASTKGAGRQSIAKYLRVEPNTYEYHIENYLIAKELIVIGNKRLITDKGKALINEN